MLTAIILTIKNAFGWLVAHGRLVLYVLLGLGLLIGFGLVYRSCMKPPAPHLNEKEINDAQVAIETHDAKKMQEVLTNSDVRVAVVDSNVANAKNQTIEATQESKAKWANANVDDMAAELERRSKE